jgi:hypothetical protein
MSLFQSIIAARIIFIFGIANVLLGLLVLLTCRCTPGIGSIGAALMRNPFYKRFYRYHCYLWWLFWGSVVVHAVFAIGLVGIPF